MIKSELIHIVASRNPHLYATYIARVVDAILEDITRTLEQGGRVEIRGFGTFSVRHRLPKAGRNPRNGEAVYIIEKWVPMFKAGREMRERLNDGTKMVRANQLAKKPAEEMEI